MKTTLTKETGVIVQWMGALLQANPAEWTTNQADWTTPISIKDLVQ